VRRTPRDVKKSYRLRGGDLAGAQFRDWERRDQLHPGPSEYPHSRTALNLGLHAVANRPFDHRRHAGPADRGKRKKRLLRPVQECRGFSDTSLSLSAIRPSSGSERAFIFRMARLRWTFTVASAMPISPAICLLRRPCAT
jgi:hypothetical protein